jgi:hypothetical protein
MLSSLQETRRTSQISKGLKCLRGKKALGNALNEPISVTNYSADFPFRSGV